jgi:hypothetical protein
MDEVSILYLLPFVFQFLNQLIILFTLSFFP